MSGRLSGMKFRYSALGMLIIILLGMRMLYDETRSVVISREALILWMRALNAESAFALGLKVRLSQLERFDLELIPGLSEESKTKLLSRKHELLIPARPAKGAEEASPFERIKGIGRKKARILEQYISMD